jgi:serine/threonine protein kinase/Tol biopolymer transport system component
MIGQTVSHYKIVERLGAGGMGVVYKAQDIKLNRAVALKFLPIELTADADAVNRFINEAQTASALDHANICTIYEIDESEDGRMFICMAYYEGETLRKRLEKGEGRKVKSEGQDAPFAPRSSSFGMSSGLPIPETIAISTQIASGLARAHEAGVTHRDIKPENIIITTRGEVKIIDFGLAKLAGQTRLTKTGSTVGTMMYMSPEQLQGQEVDHRTDIWALGVVLYEMFAGQGPFRGDYEAALVYAIAHEPHAPLKQIRPEIPDWLQSLVDKTLEKNPETRYQDLSEFLTDLQSQYEATPVAMKRVTKPRTVRKKLLKPALLAAAFLTLSLLAFLVYRFLPKAPPPAPTTHKQITFVGDASFPAISPDGKMIAYVSYQSQPKAKVYVQDLAGGQPLPILSDINEVTSLRWSPDGAEILVTINDDKNNKTFIVPRLGGSPKLVNEYVNVACWSPDGLQIAGIVGVAKRIVTIDRMTLKPSFMSVKVDFPFIYDLDWSPLEDRLLVHAASSQQDAIFAVKRDDSLAQEVVRDSVELASPRWSAAGKSIYYLRAEGNAWNLMKIEVSSKTGKAITTPKLVQSGLSSGTVFSVSSDNRQMLYTRELNFSNLWLVHLDGQSKESTTPAEKLTTGTSWKGFPVFSPDGRLVAFSIGDGSKANIFVMPIEGGEPKQVTYFDAFNTGPAWSPDGEEIAFVSNLEGKHGIWTVDSNGGTPRLLGQESINISSPALTWAPGSEILYQQPGNRNFRMLDPESRRERLLVPNDSVGWMFSPRYSHDGKRLAVSWNQYDWRTEIRKRGVWLISLQDSSQVWISEGSYSPIAWSLDDEWIFAINGDKTPYVIGKIPVGGGEAVDLATLPFNDLDFFSLTMTSDGKRIICPVNERQADVWLMTNFDPEVK